MQTSSAEKYKISPDVFFPVEMLFLTMNNAVVAISDMHTDTPDQEAQ
jgi:hypothetical protein